MLSTRVQAAPTAPDDASCARCHAALSTKTFVHVALQMGCSQCHVPADTQGKCQGSNGKKWKLTSADPGLCRSCHDVGGKAPAHPVIEAMGCTACHDPHSSPNPKQLKEWPAGKLCAGCHEVANKKVVHTAVKRGDCLGCHDPHAGNAKPLLKKAREEVCFGCHDRKKLTGTASVHTPVATGACLGCHSPHASDNPKQLLRTGSALCLGCHAAPKKPDEKAPAGTPATPTSPAATQPASSVAATEQPPAPGAVPPATPPGGHKYVDLSAKNVHPALQMGECQDCHSPHGSPWAKQLVKPLPALCYGCHERKDTDAHVHGAVTLGRCDVCHDPHSSANDKLLRDARPADLCFRCHSDDVTGRKHVHTPVAMGECLMCHQPHGAAQAKNLPKNQPALCGDCHDQTSKKNVHPAITRFGCTACHDPHGSPNDEHLLARGNAVCLACHGTITGEHVFTSFDGKMHPLEGKPDPSRPGKTLGCISCHTPHSSDNPKLFRKAKSKMEVCNDCHGKH
ncbi:MAG TPA: cytochrome c3 family protein [Anaeromyxobacteraceae bacterium]|nr:cytochrome c3 family protein [Anaeromyxobacteraceae bacterium]